MAEPASAPPPRRAGRPRAGPAGPSGPRCPRPRARPPNGRAPPRPAGGEAHGPLPANQFSYAAPQAVPPAAPAAPVPAVAPASATQAPAQPDLTDELLRQAMEKEGQGKPEQAAALYALVLDKQPGREGASLRLGNLLYRQSRYDEAVEVFRKAIETRESAVLRNNLGSVYLAQRKLDQSRQEFAAAAALNRGPTPTPTTTWPATTPWPGSPRRGWPNWRRPRQ